MEYVMYGSLKVEVCRQLKKFFFKKNKKIPGYPRIFVGI